MHIQCIYFTCNVMAKVHFYVVVPHRSAGNGTVAMALAIYYFAMFNFHFLLFLSHRLLPFSHTQIHTHNPLLLYCFASASISIEIHWAEKMAWIIAGETRNPKAIASLATVRISQLWAELSWEKGFSQSKKRLLTGHWRQQQWYNLKGWTHKTKIHSIFSPIAKNCQMAWYKELVSEWWEEGENTMEIWVGEMEKEKRVWIIIVVAQRNRNINTHFKGTSQHELLTAVLLEFFLEKKMHYRVSEKLLLFFAEL